MSALKFIQLVARKKVAQKGGEGITTIGNRMNAEAKAGEIAETFRLSGLTPDKWDDFIKSEKDVLKYLNIIESTKKQAIEQATKKSKDILKVPKKKEKPFTGWTPKVVERSMLADDYADLKKEYFRRIMTSTDEALNTFLKKGINASDERFVALSKDQRKDFLDMVDYRLKHGNRKFMNDFTDDKGVFNKFFEKNGRTLHAYGGIAGMLGEPTYQDDNHRVPLKKGKRVTMGQPSDVTTSGLLDINFDNLDLEEWFDILKSLGVSKHASGGRVPFKLGGIDKARRLFLQAMGAGAAGIGAAKSGLFGLLKGSKSAAVKDLTSVPIKSGVDGMPSWFKPLVNKVIKEGTEVPSGAERVITHKTKLPDSKTDVYVNQHLDTGDVTVDIGMEKHGFPDGKFGQPVRLEYKAAEEIEPILAQHMDPKDPKGFWKPHKDQKTKPEFTVEEAEFTGGHPENVKFEEVSVNKFGKHESNFDEVEMFATGKKKKTRNISSLQKQDEDIADHFSNYPAPDDYASGGRVPFKGGKKVLEGLAKLMDEFFPGTTKIGQRSKPFPGKVQEKMDLRKALAEFIEREKAAKLKELKTWEDPDKVRAAVDDIFSTGDYKYDAQMAAEALVENNPKAFGNKLFDDLDDKTRTKIYGAVLDVVQSDLGKMLQLKRASKPTKTLKGIEETGTIDISDPNIAEEFTKFMKETDPKGYAKIQKVVDDANQQLELKRFKPPKGKKGHASGGRVSLSSGGLAGILGE